MALPAVHHGIWDYDLPCAPILADITVDGKLIKAVAQPSKQGFLYVFDRQTGQPVWPIVERPVEKGTVPGEWYSPTQPFPTKPPPFELQGIQEKDLIDFTPEILAEAKVASTIKLGPLFTTPPSGQRFAKLYAYDKATGREVANVTMPAPQTGNPMTYMLNGSSISCWPSAGLSFLRS